MLKFFKLTFSPLLSFFSLMMGSSFLMTLLPIRASLEGFSPEISGYLASAYYLGVLIGAIKIHKLIEGIGHVQVFAFFASFISILTLIQGLYTFPIFWIFIRFLFGLGMGGIFVTIESWLVVQTKVESRGTALSLYMMIFYASSSMGQLFLGFFDPQSIYPFCAITIFTSFSILPLAITKLKSPIIEESSYLSPLRLYKIVPLAMIAAFFTGLILGSIYGLLPVFAQSSNYTNSQISWIMLSAILGGFIFQWPIGVLSDFVDRRKILFIMSVIFSLIFLFLCFYRNLKFWNFILYSIAMGGSCFVIYPLTISYACDVIESKNIVATPGALLVSYGIGSILGPIFASYSMVAFDAVGLFYFLAFTGIAFSLNIFFRIFISRQVSLKDRLPYSNLPQTTPVIFELDPRTDQNKEDKKNSSEQDKK